MKILLTGATGYIAKRLLPVFIERNYEVTCVVRDRTRFDYERFKSDNLTVIELDFLNVPEKFAFPDDIDVAYYLIHSMASSTSNFEIKEVESALLFVELIDKTNAK